MLYPTISPLAKHRARPLKTGARTAGPTAKQNPAPAFFRKKDMGNPTYSTSKKSPLGRLPQGDEKEIVY